MPKKQSWFTEKLKLVTFEYAKEKNLFTQDKIILGSSVSRVANILHNVITHAKQLVRERTICPYCGGRNLTNDTICRKCGRDLPSAEDLR